MANDIKVKYTAETSQAVSATDSLAKSTALLKGTLDSAQGSLSKFGSVGSLLSGHLGTLTAALSVGGLIAFADKAIHAQAALHDMSIATGASVEMLSTFKLPAKLAGTSLEELTGSFKKLNVAMLEARINGDGEKARVFKALGIDVSTIKDAGELTFQLADALSKMGNQSQAVAVLQMLMGKGANMVFMREVAEQGRVVAKNTAEGAAAADQYLDNMTKLQGAAGQLGTSLANQLLPGLVSISEYLLEAKKEGAGLFGVFSNLGSKAGDVSNEFNPFVETMRALIVIGGNVGYVFKGVGTEIGGIAAQIAAIGRGDFRQALEIGRMMKADAEKARADHDAWEKRVIEWKPSAPEKKEKKRDKDTDLSDLLGKPSKSVADKKSDFDRLRETMDERIAIQQGLADAGGKMNETEREWIRYSADLLSGKIKLTAAERDQADAWWQSLRALSELNDERKEAAHAEVLYNDITRNLEGERAKIAAKAELIGLTGKERAVREALQGADESGARARERLFADEKLSDEKRIELLLRLDEELERHKDLVQDATQASWDYAHSWEAGVKDAVSGYLESANDMASQSKRLMENAFGGMEDALVKFVQTGKLDFKSLANSIIADVIRIQARAALAPITQGIGDWVSGLFSNKQGSVQGNADYVYDLHTGGVAGQGGSGRFLRDMSLFDHAPRYHAGGTAGLKPDEVPAVLLRGETVLPRGASAAASVAISMPVTIDARNADPSVMPSIRDALAEMENRIYRNVPGVIRAAQLRSRVTPAF